ncbi:shikimate kinase [Olsenella profusa]|uniref:Shikimate kinase n=2 Tax=Olsenella profusa TaxID=138595 RepID=A0ABS2EZD1_9ACTN|nr:shikimate kinase [Olsenella profusa]MBM6774074.1 shikimate kinase [Olsenella profusa]
MLLPDVPAADAPFGLVGHPLGHSWSREIHERLGSAPYELHDLEPDEVAPFVRGGSWRGLNVTIPYKRQAAELADERSPRVERLGVANTLVRREDGSVLAENTDVLGFAWMLARFCRQRLGCSAHEALCGRTALVLGSGGASQAVQAALEDPEVGARVVVVSRRGPETYDGLAERHPDAALIVNTTPVGMYPACPASPLDEEVLDALTGLRGVLDVVYNPERTGVCLAAERHGIVCESGLAMLVAQALYSSELFQGVELDDALVAPIEAELYARTENVVLIGMPGAGKTSCGRALARLMGRPFVDLDEAIHLECGRSAEEIIRQDGEDAFRAVETRVTGSYGARSGLVIACGGGVVTRPENYDLLHQNGRIVLLDRPLSELSDEGRPMSQARGVEQLAAERMGLYRAWADVVLPCTGSAAGDAELALQLTRRDSPLAPSL